MTTTIQEALFFGLIGFAIIIAVIALMVVAGIKIAKHILGQEKEEMRGPEL